MSRIQIQLLFLCLVLTSPAWAEWVKVADHSEGILYIDPATMRKDGNLRKVWTLSNLKKRTKNGELSIRSRQEIDCKEERIRILSASSHTDFWTDGKEIFHTDAIANWYEVPPNTDLQKSLQIVCTK